MYILYMYRQHHLAFGFRVIKDIFTKNCEFVIWKIDGQVSTGFRVRYRHFTEFTFRLLSIICPDKLMKYSSQRVLIKSYSLVTMWKKNLPEFCFYCNKKQRYFESLLNEKLFRFYVEFHKQKIFL